jgi:putative DNA methylase
MPEGDLAYEPRAIWCTLYGQTTFADLFTARQLVSLTTFVDCLPSIHQQVVTDAASHGMANDGVPLSEGGRGARAYADAIVTYLALALSRAVDYGCRLATWRPKDGAMRSGLAKQALPFTWDFAEGSPFGPSSAGFAECVAVVANCVALLPYTDSAEASQIEAGAVTPQAQRVLICTDPPYYDNIGYADLADFFYAWLRPALKSTWPGLFSTLQTPKQQELIASPYRSGDKQKARQFFEQGLERVFSVLRSTQSPSFPMIVFYAFKQSETKPERRGDGATIVASTGWESMLEGMLRSGLMVTGTWPMRTEGDNRQVGIGANALASSIVLVCRPRPLDSAIATRREFLTGLRGELPPAVRKLQQGSIAPVDLAQSAIGPGMAVFSRYAKVVEADGSPMTVRAALGLINQVLDETLSEQESDFDGDTRWALAWFEDSGMNPGPFGRAETLSKAKNTSINGLVEAGFLESKGGKVRLLDPSELAEDWDPVADARLTIWEVAHYLIRALETGGEEKVAELLRRVGGLGETARELAYRLYVICERKKWAKEALAYNSLVVAWPEIARLASSAVPSTGGQETLL